MKFRYFHPAILIALLFISGYSSAQPPTDIKKEKYNEYKPIEDEVGYTHAVKVGKTIYISGTVGSGDMPAQITSIYESIKATLVKYNATFQNVVKENIYAVDLELFIKHKDIRKKYYGNDFPAATWVEVKRLYLPEYKVEVEIIAELKE